MNNFFDSFKIAFLGLCAAFKKERNFRLQCLAALVVVLLALILRVDSIGACILILTMMVVLCMELINSQIEKFLDIIQPEHHHKVKIIKDFSAAAVLLSAIGSVAVGLLIFLPHILRYFV